MKKRVLSILLTLVMALGLLPAMASAADLPFTDVPKNAWYYSDVENAVASGLVNGKTATTYAPDDNLTYAEAVKLASCMWMEAMTGSTEFEPSNPWYQTYVDYAKTNGIIKKDYDWNSEATRAGYMDIFSRAMPETPALSTRDGLKAINNIPDGAIPDVPMTHPQAAGIYKLYRAGILQGNDAEHNCKPNSNIKRSEVAAILTRMTNSDKRVSFSMDVIKKLTVIEQPQPLALEDNVKEIGSLTVAVSGGTAPYTYQWYKEDGTKVEDKEFGAAKKVASIKGSSTAELEVRQSQGSYVVGVYYCVITDADGNTVTSNKAAVTFDDPLSVYVHYKEITAEVGGTAALSVTAMGGKEPYTYEWRYQNTGVTIDESSIYSSTKTDTLTIKNITKELSGGVYTCTVKDADGNSVTGDTITLTVTAAASELTITKHPQNASVQETGTATFTVAAAGGTAPYTYQWYYKNTGVKVAESAAYIGTKTDTLTIKNVAGALNGFVYACQVTDMDGKYVSSNPATLTVTAAPNTFEATVTNTTKSGKLDGETINYIMANEDPAVHTRVEFSYKATGPGAADASYVIQFATCGDDYKTWRNSSISNEKGPAAGSLKIDMAGNAVRKHVKMRVKAVFPNGKILYSEPVYLVYPLAVRQWTGDNFSMVCIDGGIGPFQIKWNEYDSSNKLLKCVAIDTTDVSDNHQGRVHILTGSGISNAKDGSQHTRISTWLGCSKYVCTITDALGNIITSREALHGNESNNDFYNGDLWTLWEQANGDISSLETSTINAS